MKKLLSVFILAVVPLTAALVAGPVWAKNPFKAVENRDTDGDGKLSPQEFEKPRRIFNKIDKDKDGFLSPADFAKHWGMPLPGGGPAQKAAAPAAAPVSAAGLPDLYIIDAHSQADHLVNLNDIIPLMDRAGVKRTILATRGKLKPGQIRAFAEAHPGRITAAVRTKGWPYADNGDKYYKLLNAQLAMPVFRGMAEVIIWHAKKGKKAPEWDVPIDTPQAQAALKVALERGWPFIPHYEFAAAAGRYDEMMADLEGLLRAHPTHPFLMVHMGQLKVDEAKRLIEAHPNIHFLTSHANSYAAGKSVQPWTVMVTGDGLKPAWKALVEAHPDRFVMAFDNVFAEHWGDYYLEQVKLWRKALAQLPPAAAQAIAHGNAERLWGLGK